VNKKKKKTKNRSGKIHKTCVRKTNEEEKFRRGKVAKPPVKRMSPFILIQG
jgi:hypothetical protein